jgi:hypothetical protein
MTRLTRPPDVIALLAVAPRRLREPAQPNPAATLDARSRRFQAARKAGDEAKATALAYSWCRQAELATFVTRAGGRCVGAAFKFVDLRWRTRQ